MIVVDSMILTYHVLQHPTFAREVDATYPKDSTWAAPDVWRSEPRSSLLQYVRTDDDSISRGDLTLEEAKRRYAIADDLLRASTMQVEAERVFDLAMASGCSAYDCEYVALAQALDRPLVTLDRQVLDAFAETALTPQAFTSA